MSEQPHTVLIVEDELLVREAISTVLEEESFKILLASNGDEAVEIFIEHYEEIDLVLLDMQMPGKNGDDALEEMQFIDPDIKVIFVTGVLVEWEALGAIGIIQKPFLVKEIVRTVRTALDLPT